MSKNRRRVTPTADAPVATAPARTTKWAAWAVVAVVAAAGVALWFALRSSPQTAAIDREPAPALVAEFADEKQCAACHATQADAWHGSHHDLAMQEANAATVLGNFDNAVFSKDGVRTRFSMRDGKYFINTDGPDGKLADFEVKYTFGVEPLQQYLVELDRGRMQAFTIAWDTQRKRWFHLYPDERIDSKDELHWTKPSQNWNFMCAECHSTDLKKNYDPQTQTYNTTWKQIDVGCQACHGPASEHLAWAQKRAGRDARDSGQPGSYSGPTPRARRSASGFVTDPMTSDSVSQIEACARCHSRRAPIWGDYRHGKPLMDTHLPSLLEASLYFADGQIDGEVYEYGSFLQSKMHQKGLRCSDCHEPHTLQTRAPGNALCVSCHNASTPATRAGIDTSGLKHKDYDSPAHHFHQAGKPGSQCVDCHAPQRTYMVVDPRRDHSFRIPRPDLSAKLGTPNACNGCHDKRSSQWATEVIAKWYGSDRRQESTYGEVLWAGRTRQPGAANALSMLAQSADSPAIVRASALRLLRDYPGEGALETFRSQSAAADPLIRLAAMSGLAIAPPEQRANLVAAFLSDPVRAIRLDAIQSMAEIPESALDSGHRQQRMAGVAEFAAAQRENADQPGSWMNLGNLSAAFGDVSAAEADYQAAIRLDPTFVPAYVNLADLKSRTGMNAVAIQLLQTGLAEVPENAALQHALGLALTRERRYDEAIDALGRAANNDPRNARYAFVHGVALFDTGRKREGVAALEKALQRNPGDRDLLSALAAYAQQAGDAKAAQAYLSRLHATQTISVPEPTHN